MGRVIQMDGTGKAEHWQTMEFRREGRWSEVLGGIGVGPRADGELVLQRLIQLYPDILPWDELEDAGAGTQANPYANRSRHVLSTPRPRRSTHQDDQ